MDFHSLLAIYERVHFLYSIVLCLGLYFHCRMVLRLAEEDVGSAS
jgi:hypothetical protein